MEKIQKKNLNSEEKKALKNFIDTMLSERKIQEVDSQYSSDTLLIKKSNGSYRVCVDYRLLNSKTKDDIYLMPKLEDLLRKIKIYTW
jgi:hypothetical protein